MKYKSIFFVTPGGKSVKAIKIRSVAVVIAAVVMLGGFSAYFIPSEKFRLKAVEIKQKQQLSVQNEQLHLRITSALDMLNRLRQQIIHLDAKKERVTELTGAKTALPKDPGLSEAATTGRYHVIDPQALLEHTVSLESRLMSSVSSIITGDGNPFDRIPVCKPAPEYAIVSLRFGKTRDPFTGRQSHHRGIDFAAAAGTPVIATATGKVVLVEKNAVWGNRVVIAHADSIGTVYAHLGSVATAGRRAVKRGEVIGTIGNSGLTTGPHVHYEIWKNGVAVDPEIFFFPAGLVSLNE